MLKFPFVYKNNNNKFIDYLKEFDNHDFDGDLAVKKYDYSNWYAMKHPTNTYGEWSISPKKYFNKHGFIPDCHANLKINGMEEIMDYTYKTIDNSDGIEILKSYGFEILENPKWYYLIKKIIILC